jgi:DNA-binding transcriptional regulator/RsmH inhibitor MraZ
MMQALRAGKEGPLFLVRFLDDGFLRLVTQEQLDRMLDRIRDHPKLDAPQKAAAIRHLSSGAKLVEPDQQGRFVLPSQLVQEMGLREEVAFCGAQNRIEIWPAAARRDLESADQQVLRKLEPAIKEVLDL